MICSRCKKEFISQNYKTCDNCRKWNKDYRDKIPRLYKQGEFSSKDGISKKCSDCLQIKLLKNFYTHKRYKDGYRNQCIECHSKRWKVYYNEGYNLVLKNKALNDMIYRLKQNQKSYLHQQLKNSNLKKINSTNEYIGCNINQLKSWLESQFESDMNWINKSWQLDHIIPVSLFNLENDLERKIAFNWTNIQPLYKKDNLQKYNNIRPYEYFSSIVNVCNFIKKQNLDTQEYHNVKNSLQWFKQTYVFCDTFKLRGSS